MKNTPKTSARLRPGQASELAFDHVMLKHCAKLRKQLVRYQETNSEDAVHKSRVALRRLTTSLDAFRPLLRKSQFKAWRSEAKALFRALGEVRDADVYLAALPDEERSKKLITRTAWLREKTWQHLRRKDAAGFASRLEQAVRDKAMLRRSRDGMLLRGRAIEMLAGEAMDGIWADLNGHGTDLAAMSAKERHQFRKDMKTFRYLTDDLAPLWPKEGREEAEDRIRALQEDLGTLNDMANAASLGQALIGGEEEDTILARASSVWSEVSGLRPWWRQDGLPAAPDNEDANTE